MNVANESLFVDCVECDGVVGIHLYIQKIKCLHFHCCKERIINNCLVFKNFSKYTIKNCLILFFFFGEETKFI